MDNLTYAGSIHIGRPPEALYRLVSDITRMGGWSPICKACWWDDAAQRGVGAWFTGRNETPDRTWETHCRVIAASPGREFAFVVDRDGLPRVRWGYSLAPEGDGTRLTETWELLPGGIATFHERYGPEAQSQIEERIAAAHRGIPATLAAIKKTAEEG